MLLLLLSRFSRVQLYATPSLGFSRQEHWSGVPFPSPKHEHEKWKWNCSVVSNPQRPHGLQPSRLLCPWDFPGKSTGVGCQHTYIKSYKYFTSSGRPVSSLLWHRWPRTRKILFLGILSVGSLKIINCLFQGMVWTLKTHALLKADSPKPIAAHSRKTGRMHEI